MDGARRVSYSADRLANRLAEIAGRLGKAMAGSSARPAFVDSGASPEDCARAIVFSLFVARCNDSGRECSAAPSGKAILLQEKIVTEVFVPLCAAAQKILDEAAELLAGADIQSILNKISSRYQTLNPAVYFHELLLARCDGPWRRSRGVYYTPAPVVSYLVNSVDHILQTDFQLPDGLAQWPCKKSRPLQVVDPACGSGAFLSAVAAHLEQHYCRQGNDTPWNESVLHHLPSRLLGFELLGSSCAAARLLLARQLGTSGSDLPELVHALNPLQDHQRAENLLLGHPHSQPLLVVMGNPPYGNFGKQNRGPWIRRLLLDYKQGLHEKKLNLDDDFIKFIRCAQHWIDSAGSGILAFITNNTYLNGITHRRMRRSLCESFHDIYLLDLHGSSAKKEHAPGGSADENVFDIRQGVAICLMVKRTGDNLPARVRYAELWGSRQKKFAELQKTDVSSTRWQEVFPSGEQFSFHPRPKPVCRQYQSWPKLTDIFLQIISGVQTKNDARLVDISREALSRRMQKELSNNALASKEPILFSEKVIRPYMVAPLDKRWVYYDQRLIGRARYSLMQHMSQGNVALLFMRQSTSNAGYDHFLVTDSLASDRVFYSAHGAPFLAPLYLTVDDSTAAPLPPSDWQPNLQPAFIAEIARRIGLEYVPCRMVPCSGANSLNGFDARDLLNYLYAIFYSPAYRRQYAEPLRSDFPRLPLPSDAPFFWRLSNIGRQLIALHLLQSIPSLDKQAGLHGEADPLVSAGFPKYDSNSGRVQFNRRYSIEGIEPQVWNFTIGGYPVLRRWLRQRRGRQLSDFDLNYFQQLVVIARKTIAMMKTIDRLTAPWLTP